MLKAICDKREAAVKFAQNSLKKIGRSEAQEFFGSEDSWKKLVELPDLDLIYTCTPWILHTPILVYAMEHGKHIACEVPIARTIDEAWQLVETSERTKKHCMMLENYCYDFFELLTLNMARRGMFGDIIHGEGAYIHNLMGYNFNKPVEDRPSDGALWSSIAPLSEWSVANKAQSIDVPDFTCGSWKTNKPHGINLETGGTTKVLEIKVTEEADK